MEMIKLERVEKEIDCPIHGKQKAVAIYFPDESKESAYERIDASYCPLCKSTKDQIEDDKLKAEEEKQKAKEVDKAIENAGVYKDNFYADLSTVEDKYFFDLLKDLATGKINTLVIVGSEGRGKTYMAIACMREYAKQDYNRFNKIIYDTASGIARKVRSAIGGRKLTEQDVFSYYADADFLVVDEMGKSNNTDYNSSLMSDLFDSRLSNFKSTIIISNLSPKELSEAYLDAPLRSRILRGGKGVIAEKKGEDLRRIL